MSPLQVVGEPAFNPQAPLELKIKQESLGYEIAVIRFQEARLERRRAKAAAKGYPRVGQPDRRLYDLQKLTGHRMELKVEARATNLARGFLKGYPYERIEVRAYEDNEPPFERAGQIALKYAKGDERFLKQRFENWVQEGSLYFQANAIKPKSDPARQVEVHRKRMEMRHARSQLTAEDRAVRKTSWIARTTERIRQAIGISNGQERGPLAEVQKEGERLEIT